ncbi:hypothetical protein LZK73_28080 (plasmid) [Neorhizobium galegae]|nr:hypothetical protein LZK73_28080 [Neorhizobium galegae]
MFILLGFVKVLNAMKVDFRTATHARAFEDTLRFSLVGNNRAETSHLLLRKRERTMQGADQPEVCGVPSRFSWRIVTLRHATAQTLVSRH